MHLFSDHNHKQYSRDLMTEHRPAVWRFHLDDKLQLVCLCFHIITSGTSAMRSERVRMVARLLKISKTLGRKCIHVTARLWFGDLNSYYLATALMKDCVVEVCTAVCNNILSPFFFTKIKRGFWLKFLFFLIHFSFILFRRWNVYVDIVIVIVYWPYYRLRLRLVLVIGKKLVNEHFSS